MARKKVRTKTRKKVRKKGPGKRRTPGPPDPKKVAQLLKTALLTPEEVAVILRIHTRTVTRLIANGELRGIRLGSGTRSPLRIRQEDLEAFLEEGETSRT